MTQNYLICNPSLKKKLEASSLDKIKFYKRCQIRSVEPKFHDNRILAGAVVMPSQTSFFKFELSIKLTRGQVGAANFQRNHTCAGRFGLRNRLGKQNGADSEPPTVWINRDVEDVAFVGD